MEWTISEEELRKLVELTEKIENRKFASDSWVIAAARVVFVKWMKVRGLWSEYTRHLRRNPDMLNRAWENPQTIEDFLGNCNYGYSKAYVPWYQYVRDEFEKTILKLVYEYEHSKDSEVC